MKNAPITTEDSPGAGDPRPEARVWRRVWRFLRPRRRLVVGAVLLIVAAIPFVNLHPYLWKVAVDDVLPTRDARALAVLLAVLLGSYVIGTILKGLHLYLLELAGQGFIKDVRTAVFDKLQNQSLAYHHDHRSGDLVTRVVSDVDAMENSVLRGVASLIEELLTFVWVGAFVIAIQPVIGLCTLVPLAVSFVIVRIYNVRVKSVYGAIRRKLGDVGAYVGDRLGGIQLIQGFVRQAREGESFAGIAERYRIESIRAARYRIVFFGNVSLFGFLTNVVMLGLGLWMIWKGSFTVGGLIAYRGFWWRFQSPINTLAQTSDILQRARAAAIRVLDVLEEPVAVRDPAEPRPLPAGRLAGGVAFERVTFRYGPDSAPAVLRGVTFNVEPGEFVALAGHSGSGKTTLLNLVPRFYEASGGRVLVDGRDVRTLRLDDLRGQVGIVAQDSYLFAETILDNIRFARPDATEDEVTAAARLANAHEFIESLPRGYATLVGERGVKLSGGQRQRISIARTFLRDPAVLLLDEPTSSVEPGSEAAIHEALLKLSEGRTTLLATHRVTLLERAPRILFLHQGEILGDGTHADLLDSNERYRESYGASLAAETV